MWGCQAACGRQVDCDVLVFGDDKTARDVVIDWRKQPECAVSMAGGWPTPLQRGTDVCSDRINRRYKVNGAGIRITGILFRHQADDVSSTCIDRSLNDPEWNIFGLFNRGANSAKSEEYVMTGLPLAFRAVLPASFSIVQRTEPSLPGSAAGAADNSEGASLGPEVRS